MRDPFANPNAKPLTPNDTQQECPFCNSKLANTFMDGGKCPNCNTTINKSNTSGVPPHAAPAVKPRAPRTPDLIPKNTPLNMSNSTYNAKTARSKKRKDHAEDDPETTRDTYLSEPFDQCGEKMRGRKDRINDDRKLEVMRSCTDLAIDG